MHGFLRCHLDPELRAGEVLARKFLEVRSLTHLPSASDSSSAAAREGVPPVQLEVDSEVRYQRGST